MIWCAVSRLQKVVRLVALRDYIIERWVLIKTYLASLGQVAGTDNPLKALLQEHIYGVWAPLVLKIKDLGCVLWRI